MSAFNIGALQEDEHSADEHEEGLAFISGFLRQQFVDAAAGLGLDLSRATTIAEAAANLPRSVRACKLFTDRRDLDLYEATAEPGMFAAHVGADARTYAKQISPDAIGFTMPTLWIKREASVISWYVWGYSWTKTNKNEEKTDER